MKTKYLKHLLFFVCYGFLAFCSNASGNEVGGGKPSQADPITTRVNIQSDTATRGQIIDGCWVAVGTKAPHALQYDYSRPFDGKPSYRFVLLENDNTLEGYNEGDTKGRIELSYCYATSDDFKEVKSEAYQREVTAKTVYHYGKGISPQASSRVYRFSIFVPSDINSDVSTIFAQWHGMPDRRLARTPEGEVRMLSDDEFAELASRTIFKKDTGYEKVVQTDKNGQPKRDDKGNIIYKAGKENGWLIEQGGYPPLAFGFGSGYFYIKTNSDRRWMTDKTDRTNANIERSAVGKQVRSEYKTSVIAYRMPIGEFPKDCWVSFEVKVDWSRYGGKAETIEGGALDVKMSYQNDSGKQVLDHLVKDMKVPIGRNDEHGYYFKFGIYRVNNSTVPVSYNLAGYSEQDK